MSLIISSTIANDASLLAEVCALLQTVQLPIAGVAAHFNNFLVAQSDEKLCGCVGLEIYENLALLRSLAVNPAHQKVGLGKLLAEKILSVAREKNVHEIVLLTTTAQAFFVNKFGFTIADRADYDKKLSRSPEWNLPRCASAVLLRLQF